MTNKDARTPASNQDEQSIQGESSTQHPTQPPTEAGKSIGWHKAYGEGSRPDLRVPVRQVHLTNGQSVQYQSSGGDLILFFGGYCHGTGNANLGTRVPGIAALTVNGNGYATLTGDEVQASYFVRLGGWAAQVLDIGIQVPQGGFTNSTIAIFEAKR